MKFILLFSLIILILPFSAQAEDIVDGDLIRADLDVYIVKLINEKKFKRLILNPEIFNQYSHLTWEMIKDVDQSVIDRYSITDLIRVVDDDKIYKLYPNGDIGEKRWITTADVFLDLGYDWDAVYNINSFERDFYVPGDDLVADVVIEPEPEPVPEPEPEPEIPVRDPITINVPGDYSTIQAAIDAAIDGDTISINGATYNENILLNKNLSLIGTYALAVIVNGQINIEDAEEFLIQRFTIENNNGKAIYCSGSNLSKGTIKNVVLKNSDYGIYADGNCDLSILNNLVYNHKDSDNSVGILIKNNYSYGVDTEIINNTIDGNYTGIWSENADLIVMNNIITSNLGKNNSTGVYHSGDGESVNTYNDVWQNGTNYNGTGVGTGSFAVNPNYILVSQRNYKLNINSSMLSPCIDKGNPSFIYNDRIILSGNYNYRNDLGAYGGPENVGWTP